MITNLWNVLCNSIITDQNTNSVSYINCIEGLKAVQLPATLPPINIGTLWLIEPENGKAIKFKLRLSLEKPDDSSKQCLFETPEKIYSQRHRERINFQLGGLEIQREGKYKFVVEYYDGNSWNITNDVLLDIEVNKQLTLNLSK